LTFSRLHGVIHSYRYENLRSYIVTQLFNKLTELPVELSTLPIRIRKALDSNRGSKSSFLTEVFSWLSSVLPGKWRV
jgi:hypothetical protein